jgi:hypothetical protein
MRWCRTPRSRALVKSVTGEPVQTPRVSATTSRGDATRILSSMTITRTVLAVLALVVMKRCARNSILARAGRRGR